MKVSQQHDKQQKKRKRKSDCREGKNVFFVPCNDVSLQEILQFPFPASAILNFQTFSLQKNIKYNKSQ